MSQTDLEYAHRLLTDAMIARATGQGAPAGSQFTEHELKPLQGLPLTGCHIDPTTQCLVITMEGDTAPQANEHRRRLRPVLDNISFQIVYITDRDLTAPSKTGRARPLWGGVEMGVEKFGGTLTLVVAKDGANYTLVSAHVVGVAKTGQAVGQPAVGADTYGVVTLNPAGPARTSDSALASITESGIQGERDRIWRGTDEAYRVTAKAKTSELTDGKTVYMQGAFSNGLQEGKILATNVTSVRKSGLVLTGQIKTSCPAIHGDSGAPMFLAGAKSDEVTFAGILVGTYEGGYLFSPWDGIKADLGL